jgi:DNA-directed RNA polymerase subunit RPC12/RpoP
MPDADSENRCPKCHHSWVTHGSEPDTDGCWLIMSSMAERTAMAEEDRRLQRQGVPPESCRAARLPQPTALRLSRATPTRLGVGQTTAHEAARQRELYGARPGRLDRNQPGRINGLEIALAASAAAVTQTDDVDHCPRCRHRWAMHTPDHGCSFPASTPAGVHFCGCEERPAQGSDWEVRLTQNTDH